MSSLSALDGSFDLCNNLGNEPIRISSGSEQEQWHINLLGLYLTVTPLSVFRWPQAQEVTYAEVGFIIEGKK